MSQAKVDRYKKEKKNRAKELKKKRVKKILALFIGACLVGVAIGYPLGKVLYKRAAEKRAANATIAAANYDYWSQLYFSEKYAGKLGLKSESEFSNNTGDTDNNESDNNSSSSDANTATDADSSATDATSSASDAE